MAALEVVEAERVAEKTALKAAAEVAVSEFSSALDLVAEMLLEAVEKVEVTPKLVVAAEVAEAELAEAVEVELLATTPLVSVKPQIVFYRTKIRFCRLWWRWLWIRWRIRLRRDAC